MCVDYVCVFVDYVCVDDVWVSLCVCVYLSVCVDGVCVSLSVCVDYVCLLIVCVDGVC